VQKATGLDPDRLSRQWRPALIAFFVRRVGSHAEAEDLTQEVFIRLLNGTNQVSNPEAFIFEIARNLVNDHARKLKVRDRYRAAMVADDERGLDTLDPHTIAIGREKIALFVKALGELPEKTRTMYTLYRFENISQDVIGDSFGVSASAVKQQIAKATAHIVKKLRETE